MLSVVMVTSLLAGCGSSSAPAPDASAPVQKQTSVAQPIPAPTNAPQATALTEDDSLKNFNLLWSLISLKELRVGLM